MFPDSSGPLDRFMHLAPFSHPYCRLPDYSDRMSPSLTASTTASARREISSFW